MEQKKEIWHTFLARLGKKRLRPGGVEATNWLIEKANFSANTNVLEVACNMCTTSIELAQKYKCKIIWIDLDIKALEKAKTNILNARLEDFITLQQWNALKLPFEDNSFDIVINEAMLTMLPLESKKKALSEYFRVLKPGGRLITHDVWYTEKNLDDILQKLRETINVAVTPLHIDDWENILKETGFSKIERKYWKMSLMSPIWMIRDEWFFWALKIIRNGMKKENGEMFKNMKTFFNKTWKDLKYVAFCSTKEK